MYKNKKVILTTIACRRPVLLDAAIRSFGIFCQDKDIIDEIYYLDDSSSNTDRRSAINTYINFIGKPVIFRFVERETFPDNYRHARMLNIWRECIINSEAYYVFHLEDDHQFYNHFTIHEPIDIMQNYNEYAYIGFCHSWKNFPIGIVPRRIIGNFWETIYFPNRPINDLLFMDYVAAMQTGPNIWMQYINWPYFSLRPGVHDAKRLLSVGEFSTSYDTSKMSVELEFAIRWTNKGYKSMMYKHFCSLHTGQDASLSAYTLNNSAR